MRSGAVCRRRRSKTDLKTEYTKGGGETVSKKKILWICGIAWLKKDNTYFPEATYPGIVSGSAFQQAIIEGLEDQGYNVRILSDCDMSSGERLEWSHNGKSHDVRVAGNGNRFLRIPTKIIHLFKEISRGDVLDGIEYVCAYEMHLPYLLCLHKIKKRNPHIKTVLICPDVSIYMDLDAKKKPVKSFLKQIEHILSHWLLKCVDGYVLFTEQMNEHFGKYGKPYTVIEGVYRNKYPLTETPKKNYIMHAGSLHYNIGIEELIEAFEQLSDKTVELWFFGSGAMDGYIREKAKENNRIRHMGFVDPQLLFEYEKKAMLLVNVRDPKAEYTRYSFPSKTFEYMASGTVFLTTDLPGIPAEYKDYIVTIPNNCVEEVKKGIEQVLVLSEEERDAIGKRARDFILNRKNKDIQSRKFSGFLSALD